MTRQEIDGLVDEMVREFALHLAHHQNINAAIAHIVKAAYTKGAEVARIKNAALCPTCGSDSMVIDTRGTSRRRWCRECGNRWSTIEVVKARAKTTKPTTKWASVIKTLQTTID